MTCEARTHDIVILQGSANLFLWKLDEMLIGRSAKQIQLQYPALLHHTLSGIQFPFYLYMMTLSVKEQKNEHITEYSTASTCMSVNCNYLVLFKIQMHFILQGTFLFSAKRRPSWVICSSSASSQVEERSFEPINAFFCVFTVTKQYKLKP